jgi:hypothetical protein
MRDIPIKIKNIESACLDVKILFINVVPTPIYYLIVSGKFITINKLK